MTAIALSLLAAIGFGSATIFTRSALQGYSFLPAVWMSLLVSFVITAVLALVFARGDIGTLSVTALLWILAVGVAHHCLGRPQNYLSVSIIGASRASLFFSTQAPFAAFFAIAFLGEALTPLVVVGTIGVVAGLVLASGDSLLEGWRTERRYLIGYLVALSAGAAYGGTNIFVKKAGETFESPLLITAISLLAGLIMLAPVAGAASTRKGATNWKDRRSLGFVALAGIAAGVGVNSLYFALQRADVVVITPIVSSSPLITLLLAHLFISRLERVTPRLVIGTVLAVAGVILVVLAGRL